MYFDLTPQQVVSSFSQAISSDFATSDMNGYEVINQEIAFQYDNLLNMLPEKITTLMDYVPGEAVTVDISGNFRPTLFAVPETVKGFVVDKGFNNCGISFTQVCTFSNFDASSASISTSGSNLYHLNDSFDRNTQYLYLYYQVDKNAIVSNSLKTILRDLVCCSLGSRIFPVGQSDSWSIVKYYCENSTKAIDKLESGWIPSEFKNIKLLNPIGGITSVRVNRS